MTRYASGRYHRASGTRNAFQVWGADLVAEGYPEPVVNSGDREEVLQEQIFREAYVPSSGPKDVGPFNDRRFWPGHGYWKRVKGNATIAAPGASNHEKRRASDLAYPYDRDTPAHRRGLVLAKRHNITCEGMGFREWWHWTFWGPLGTIDQPGTAGGNNSTSWEDIMAKLDQDDRDWLDAQFANLRKIIVAPGQNYGAGQAVLNEIQALSPLVRDTQNRVRGSDPRGDMLQLIREDLGKPIKADVDEAALAREIAPLLPGQMGALSDADVARIAKAAADEQAKRLAS